MWEAIVANSKRLYNWATNPAVETVKEYYDKTSPLIQQEKRGQARIKNELNELKRPYRPEQRQPYIHYDFDSCLRTFHEG